MSRSYRKFPKIKRGFSGNSCKYGKRRANKKVRNYLKSGREISNGSSYKRVFPKCEIFDYHFTVFKEWAIKEWYDDQYEIINGVSPWKEKYNNTLEEELSEWYKRYKSK